MLDWIGPDWQIPWLHVEKLGLTYVLTAIIGWQRESEEHNTGVRTFPIVGMASCGYVLILGANPDPNAQSRVLQGLITGIGFIGGGAILKEGATLRGTATAASIWNACVIGAAAGMQHFGIAILLTRAQSFHAGKR